MNWKYWLKGLIAAFIGGAANAVTLIIVDPVGFNLQTGAAKLGTATLIAAILNAAMYLKSAPVPEWDGNDRRNGNGVKPQ